MILSIAMAGVLVVYRCGNTYQDFPCPKAEVVQLTWTPATEQEKYEAEMLRLNAIYNTSAPPSAGAPGRYRHFHHHRGRR